MKLCADHSISWIESHARFELNQFEQTFKFRKLVFHTTREMECYCSPNALEEIECDAENNCGTEQNRLVLNGYTARRRH
ncbi:hypothetical protein Tco_0459992 [Tanacetum coccineum]